MQLPGLKREIDQIAKDKGINRDLIVEALEEAMKQAARRKYGQEKELEARFNDELGEIELFEFRTVVDEVNDPESEITIARAHEFDPEAEVGDEIGVKLDTEGFGRILAQTAKQVIIQRVRDAEREIVYNEYKDRKGEVVNGIVRRFEKGSLIVDLGRAEAVHLLLGGEHGLGAASASAPTSWTCRARPRGRRSCSRAPASRC